MTIVRSYEAELLRWLIKADDKPLTYVRVIHGEMENGFLQVVLWLPHISCGMTTLFLHTNTDSYTIKWNFTIDKKQTNKKPV